MEKAIAYINPELLKWARKNCGYSIGDAVKNSFNPEKLKKAENGEDYLTFKQLLILAKRYKRSPAFFYLKKPPMEDLIDDFRTVSSKKVNISPDLRAAILKIEQKRDLAIEFKEYDDSNYDYSYINSIHIDDSLDIVIKKVFEILNISKYDRNSWKDKYNAFNYWKEKIGRLGILIFQVSNIDVNEMRGFSISEIPYPVIALNRGDTPYGRIFTLLHEFCHLMLKKGGICTYSREDENHFDIERFCNLISAKILVPENDLLNIPTVIKHGINNKWEEDELYAIQKVFRVSKEVILRRLLELKRTNKVFYQKKRIEWSKLPISSSGGPEKIYEKILRKNSKKFIEIALAAMYDNKLTMTDISKYLNMSLKHLKDLESHLGG